MLKFSSAFRNHPFYSDFIQVKSRLQRNNFVCWLAGGAVRDLYLGRSVYDFDLVTDANTEAIKQIFPEAILVGEAFGVVKIPFREGHLFDLTTFRKEADYLDGRRPSKVSASTPKQDALRRDFTINSMFWDDENQRLIDFEKGFEDLAEQRLKCVGRAEVRFSEDYLRILRLIRFQAQLNLKVDEKTFVAAASFVDRIKKISGERIWSELKKITHFNHWNQIQEAPLFKQILKDIFNSELNSFSLKADVLQLDSSNINYAMLFMLTKLKAKRSDVQSILTERLKVSSDEKIVFELIYFCIEYSSQFSVFELAYEVEKRKGLKEVLYYLSQQEIVDRDLPSKIAMLLSQFSEVWITGDDLHGWVEPKQFKEVLKKARLMQFRGQFESRVDLLRHLKNT